MINQKSTNRRYSVNELNGLCDGKCRSPYFIRPYGTSLTVHDTGDKSPVYYRISLSGSSHKPAQRS